MITPMSSSCAEGSAGGGTKREPEVASSETPRKRRRSEEAELAEEAALYGAAAVCNFIVSGSEVDVCILDEVQALRNFSVPIRLLVLGLGGKFTSHFYFVSKTLMVKSTIALILKALHPVINAAKRSNS